MRHFERPYSLLTLAPPEGEHSHITNILSDHQELYEILRALPSVQTFIATTPLIETGQKLDRKTLKSNDPNLWTELIARSRMAKDRWRNNLAKGIKILRLIMELWGKKRDESDLIGMALEGKLKSFAGEMCGNIL